MMNLKLNLVSLVLSSVLVLTAANYKGYKVYDVIATNEGQQDILRQFSENEGFDFFTLTKALNSKNRVMVTPSAQKHFVNVLEKYQFNYDVINEDVYKSLEQEQLENKRNRSSSNGNIDFENYHNHETINAYLDQLASNYDNRVTVETVGLSYEKRSINTITITNGDNKQNKKIIFVDGGMHACEWVSPAAALYIIYQLVEKFDENKDLLEDYDWIILPVVNPDGYEYSQLSPLNRFWRKTRSRNNVISLCNGADPNRNFDFHWGENGASNSACLPTYQGAFPFSEPESVIVSELLLSNPGLIKFYLTIHSFGKHLLYPWGWTEDLPETLEDLNEVASAGATAIFEATGTEYNVGTTSEILYTTSGSSRDYAYGVAKIPISITMELPAGGLIGFDAPPSDIDPFVKETWVGVRAMAEKVIQKY